jgi:hypothetical protein
MGLTLREGYSIKCCMKLIAVISHNNYCCQFYQSFLIPNGINEFMDLKTVMFCLLLESVLLEVDHYLAIYIFFNFAIAVSA